MGYSVGNVDFWANGGKTQPPGDLYPNSHKAAPYYFDSSIARYPTPENCSYLGYRCMSSECSENSCPYFEWNDTERRDEWATKCGYGNTDGTEVTWPMGEYILLESKENGNDVPNGSYLVFLTSEADYCYD